MQLRASVRPAVAGLALVIAALAVPASSSATPIAVHLRVEGSAGTLFDGPVTTDGESVPGFIKTTVSNVTTITPTTQPCDVGDNGQFPSGGTHYGNPISALYDASKLAGFAFNAQWYSAPSNDYFVTQAGPDVQDSNPPYEAWGYAVNFTTAGVGGCEFQLAPGSNVVWAYDYFNKTHLLQLTGPASVNLNTPFTVNVTDGQTGAPIANAAIGSATTDAGGNAQITLGTLGTQSLKATRSDSVRSNGLVVCVHNGNDGTCGTTLPTTGVTTTAPSSVLPPPKLHALAIRDHASFAHGGGPRTIAGSFEVDPAGIVQVLARLERLVGLHCQAFNGKRFVNTRCGIAHAPWVRIGNGSPFSYNLPARLAAGHYVLQVYGVDGSGHRETTLERGLNWLVFTVG